MNGNPVVFDVVVKAQAAAARAEVNAAGATLRLYRNDISPTPLTVMADFLEPTWVGYAPVALVGLWPSALQVRPSWYQLKLPPQTYTVGSATAESCYGLFLERAGMLLYSEPFDIPFSVPIGLVFDVLAQINCSYSLDVAIPPT